MILTIAVGIVLGIMLLGALEFMAGFVGMFFHPLDGRVNPPRLVLRRHEIVAVLAMIAVMLGAFFIIILFPNIKAL